MSMKDTRDWQMMMQSFNLGYNPIGPRARSIPLSLLTSLRQLAVLQAVIDLSNRPGCFSDVRLKDEFVGDLSAEMVVHFFESLAAAARELHS